jgi:hypothetical protein
MIQDIAFTIIFGKPLLMYFGILTLLLLLSTATIGILNVKGISIIPFKWHPRLAMTTILIAIIHAIFGLSIYFNF